MNQKSKKVKAYHTPKLETHGKLATLTQQGGSGVVNPITTFDPTATFAPWN